MMAIAWTKESRAGAWHHLMPTAEAAHALMPALDFARWNQQSLAVKLLGPISHELGDSDDHLLEETTRRDIAHQIPDREVPDMAIRPDFGSHAEVCLCAIAFGKYA